MTAFLAPSALLPDGWHDDVAIAVDQDGTIASVTRGEAPAGAVRLAGPVIPGIPNAHSHAFQRAMAGTAERRTAAADSFWTWREQMYRVALAIEPEELQAVAAQLYVEQLKRGFERLTGVVLVGLGVFALLVLAGAAWVLYTGLEARTELEAVRAAVHNLRDDVSAGDLSARVHARGGPLSARRHLRHIVAAKRCRIGQAWPTHCW